MKAAMRIRPVALMLVGLLTTVAAVAVGVQVVAADTLASPTITSKPADPVSSTSATFAFTGPSGATSKCQLDGAPAAFAPCTSPKTYTGLAMGRHTFQVKAFLGSKVSAPTSYSWTVDTVPPPAPSITAKPSALSNTTSPSFSFSDSESGAVFLCKIDTGATAVCTSPRSYSGLAQGAHNFGVQARDAAGNLSPTTSWAWSIDSLRPPAPVFTQKPSDPTPNTTNVFAWSEAESGTSSQCEIENGSWFACSTPYTYVIADQNNQQHQFGVRALDATGNVSGGTYYQYKYVRSTSAVPFQITGSVSGLSLGVFKPIAITITNPNSAVIYVSALNVAIAADSTPNGCISSVNVELMQSNISTTRLVAVPAYGSVVLPTATVTAPQIRLKNLPTVNQDLCKGKSFALTYSGTAHN